MSDNSFTIILIVIFALLYGAVSLFVHVNTKQDMQITVGEKWIKSNLTKSQSYMISTEDAVYTIKDSLWEGQFRSADLYAQFKPDTTYCVTTSGMRIGIISSYKNIYRIKNQGAC